MGTRAAALPSTMSALVRGMCAQQRPWQSAEMCITARQKFSGHCCSTLPHTAACHCPRPPAALQHSEQGGGMRRNGHAHVRLRGVRVVLGHGLGALRQRVLGELTRQQQAHTRLNLTRRQCGFLVVAARL